MTDVRDPSYTDFLHTRLADWMGDLPPHLYNAPLKNLSIPGTHDSGSFYLDKTSELSPGEDKKIKAIIKELGGLEQLGKDVLYNWAVTQNFGFTDQLNNGVRYFDLRIAVGQTDSSFYFVHGLYGSKVKSTLLEIAQWLTSHPKEVVFLDFNHLFSKDGTPINLSQLNQLIDLLEVTFGRSRLCPGYDYDVDVTLATLWEKRYQVIARVLCSNSDPNEQKSIRYRINHSILWGADVLASPWPDTPSIKTLEKFLTKQVRDTTKFFVSQAILTPNTDTIVGNLLSSLKSVLANPVMPYILTWLNGKRSESGKKGVNIVIADFVDIDFLLAVIKLNYPVSEPAPAAAAQGGGGSTTEEEASA